MNDSRVGSEGVRGKRVVDSKVKEAKDQVGIVADLKGDLRELRWGEALVFDGGEKRAEVGPSGFRAVVFEN